MKFVFISHNYLPEFNSPLEWIDRIKPYTGVLEALAKDNSTYYVGQINYSGEYSNNGVKYYFLNPLKKKSLFHHRLHRLVKRLNPDIVVVYGLHFPLQVLQLRLRLNKKVKIIAQHHADKPATGWRKFLQQLADKCTNGYFFVSNEISDEWVNKGNIDNKKKIKELIIASSFFYPIDKKSAREKLGIGSETLYLFVGRLDRNKDPLLVVQAFLQYWKRNNNSKLFLIYQSEELLNEIENILRIQNYPNNTVVLVGQVSHHELHNWYCSADFFISASHQESFGLALCEAMSCGCIPVVTDIPSFRKMTGNGQCGFLFQPGSQKELFKNLLETDKIDLISERNKVLNQFKENLSFDAIAKQVQKAVSSL